MHITPTLLPTQQLWIDAPSMQRPRLLLGYESLMFQGFPLSKRQDLASTFSDSLMQELAGNAMTLPVVLGLLMSTFAAVPWAAVCQVAPPSTDAQVQDVLDILASLSGSGSGDRGPASASAASGAPAAPRSAVKRRKL